jgi:hypothetical protein
MFKKALITFMELMNENIRKDTEDSLKNFISQSVELLECYKNIKRILQPPRIYSIRVDPMAQRKGTRKDSFIYQTVYKQNLKQSSNSLIKKSQKIDKETEEEIEGI